MATLPPLTRRGNGGGEGAVDGFRLRSTDGRVGGHGIRRATRGATVRVMAVASMEAARGEDSPTRVLREEAGRPRVGPVRLGEGGEENPPSGATR
jgi:hypothetical protein